MISVPTPVTRSRAEGQTILVVEDADGLRELARRLLQRQGYTVLVAANAEDAVRLFEALGTMDEVARVRAALARAQGRPRA